jgi:chemotaxis protein histidine kinase CheA
MRSNEPSVVKPGLRLPDPGTVRLPQEEPDLMTEYVESATSLLEDLEDASLAYEQGRDRPEMAATIRRILHKLKGEAGMVGAQPIERAFHEAENAFEQITEVQRPEMLLRLKDWVFVVLEQVSRP